MDVSTPATTPTTAESARTTRYSEMPTLWSTSGPTNQSFLWAMWRKKCLKNAPFQADAQH